MRLASGSRFFVAAGAVLGLCAVMPALAQPADGPWGLKLRPSSMLTEKPSAESEQQAPAYLFGDRISGQTDVRTIVEGRAVVRRGQSVVRAHRLELEEATQVLTATEPVRVSRSGHVFDGQGLNLRIDSFEGYFLNPRYRFLSGANGQAERFDFYGDSRMSASVATYTTCERDNEESWKPAWDIEARRFDFDFEAEVGRAHQPRLRFQDVTILAWPGSVTFPLSDKRKSGFLPPSFVLDTISGATVIAPYYLDIAPNRDATLTPTMMTKRGLNLGLEFRYLEPTDQGMLRTSILPNDRLNQEDRWSASWQHTGRWMAPGGGFGLMSYSVNAQRVGDDAYWRDFPRQSQALTQRLLPIDFNLSGSRGPIQFGFRALQWQTLQDPLSPLVPPFDRLPQLTLRHGRGLSVGPVPLEASIETDFTRFSALRRLTGQTNADRLFARFQLASPWIGPAGYLTPRLQLHATHYSFEETWRGANSANRQVPTFSLDSGLIFERQAQWAGTDYIQTLEPRAFYVYTPYRDQSRLPNYDSAENNFSFATVFTENQFVGNDRIADSNLVTLGLTSRLLLPQTGAEVMRVGLAQRIRLADQRVTLSGAPASVVAERLSDVLLGASVSPSDQWAAAVITQYNPKRDQSQRLALSGRYTPTPYRLINAAYRLQRPVTTGDRGSEQIDLGWQWPLNDLWGDRGQNLGPGRGQGGNRYYSVGRLNYSATDRRLVDAVIGVEYDGCCWIGRAVLQRTFSGSSRANTQIMLQLEFVGFSRIGNNPLGVLKNNIPRYQLLRDQVNLPSRYSNYD
jgi:LPS-assembly protein